MNEGLSHFIDLLSARVPSWDADYGTCWDLIASVFPAGRGGQQQADQAMQDFMRSIEEALIDEIGFDDYCAAFVRRADNSSSVLPEHLEQRYQGSTPYEKLQLFWHEDAPKRYMFRILTTLLGETFGRHKADNVFRPLWRSLVQTLRTGEPSPLPVSINQTAISKVGPTLVPDRWNESIMSGDLQRLSDNSSALVHYVSEVKRRFIIRQDVKTLNQRTEWLEAKLRGLKLAQSIQDTCFNLAIQRREHELRAKQLALQHLQADADLADSSELTPLRKENSRLTLEAESARLRKVIRELTPAPEPVKKEAAIPPEQQRANDRTMCEDRIQKLKIEKQKALTLDDEQERLLKVNAIDDALQREMDRWAKLL